MIKNISNSIIYLIIILYVFYSIPSDWQIHINPDHALNLYTGLLLAKFELWPIIDYNSSYSIAQGVITAVLFKIGNYNILLPSLVFPMSLFFILGSYQVYLKTSGINLFNRFVLLLFSIVYSCYIDKVEMHLLSVVLILTLYKLTRKTSKKSIRRLIVFLAIIVGISFYYRHDLGIIYTITSCYFLYKLHFTKIKLFILSLTLSITPMMTLLISKGAVIVYLDTVWNSIFEHSSSNVLTHPLLFTRGYALGLTYLIFYALVFICIIFLVRNKASNKNISIFNKCLLLLYILSLPYSMGYSGIRHLTHSILPAFFLIPMLLKIVTRQNQLFITSTVIIATISGALSTDRFEFFTHRLSVDKVNQLNLKLSEIEFSDYFTRENLKLKIVKSCTSKSDPVLALNFAPYITLLSSRKPTGRHLLTRHASFHQEKYQHETVKQWLKRPPIVIFSLDPNYNRMNYSNNYVVLKKYISENMERYDYTKDDFVYINKAKSKSIKECIKNKIQKEDYKIHILGGSTAAGVPYQDKKILESMIKEFLSTASLKRNFIIKNLASRGSNSSDILKVMEDIQNKTNFVYIYTGHNEFLKLIDKKLKASSQNPFTPNLKNSPPITLKEKKAILARFQSNLQKIADITNSKNISLLISTAFSNLADWTPNKSTKKELNSSKVALELKKKGDALRSEKKFKMAYEHYVLAKDQDQLPTRALSIQNRIIKEIAQENNLPLIDLESMVKNYSNNGLSGADVFWDNCHPKLFSYYILSKEIARNILVATANIQEFNNINFELMKKNLKLNTESLDILVGRVKFIYRMSFISENPEATLSFAMQYLELAKKYPPSIHYYIAAAMTYTIKKDKKNALKFWRKARNKNLVLTQRQLKIPFVKALVANAGIGDIVKSN